MMISLDGFIEGPNHDLGWAIIDEELHTFINAQHRDKIGMYVYGRGTYEVMNDFWPTADQDPSHPDYIIEFARLWQAMPKVVFSRTLDKVDGNARLIKGNVAEEIKQLKAQPGKDLAVGGANLAGSLMQLGLVDEYQLFIQPVVIGSGTRLFSDRFYAKLKLVDTKTFHSGVVLLTYQPA